VKVEFTLSIGFSQSQHTEIVEFDDGTKDTEIEENYRDWCSGYIDGNWRVIDNQQAAEAARREGGGE